MCFDSYDDDVSKKYVRGSGECKISKFPFATDNLHSTLSWYFVN